jgi:hypothetical protein
LFNCGATAKSRAISHGAALSRGHGHAPVSATPPGVNGLYDMGGNAWEWVDEPKGAAAGVERRTRGGSWWYGQAQMRADPPPEQSAEHHSRLHRLSMCKESVTRATGSLGLRADWLMGLNLHNIHCSAIE